MPDTNIVFAREEVWVDGKDSSLTDKVIEQFAELNTKGLGVNRALSAIGIEKIRQIVVGPNHIGCLLEDGNVLRISYECSKVKDEKMDTAGVDGSNTLGSSGSSSSLSNIPPPSSFHQSTRPNNTKFRRVMLANSFRSYCRLRTSGPGDSRSVIIDRGRPVVPASAVPEELINQAQVVLQGKSREVIVRELQRTSLNVNEAVNNLLARDDEEDDMDGPADVLLSEEILQFLDGSHHHASSSAGSGSASSDAKRKKDADIYKQNFRLIENIEYWTSRHGEGIPETGKEITSIVSTSWELLALDSDGKVFGWRWQDKRGASEPMSIVNYEEDWVVQLTASNLRIACLTHKGHLISWLDETAVGLRAMKATYVNTSLPAETVIENVNEIVCSDYLAAVRQGNLIYWAGVIPLADRVKIHEKEKSRYAKKNVPNTDPSCPDIVVGAHVQTKALPMYAAGSVAVFIDASKPMIGVLLEDAWNANQRSRFRVMTTQAYDNDIPKPLMNIKQEIDEDSPELKNVSQPLFVPIHHGESRKRRAAPPTPDEKEDSRKEEIWGIDEVLWIHEHRVHDTAVVLFPDVQYAFIKYLMDNCDMTYASQTSDAINRGQVKVDEKKPDGDEDKRCLRKDDLQLATPKVISLRSPRVIQKEALRFAIDNSRKVLSLVADLNGFRILIRRNSHLYLCRVTISGKFASERRLPVFAPSLCKSQREPSLLTFGDARTIFLRDSNNAIIPLVRDSTQGFREPPTMHAPPIRLFATAAKPVEDMTQASKNGSVWEGTMLCIPGPGLHTSLHQKHLTGVTPLIQLVLYADYESVLEFLHQINVARDVGLISSAEYNALMVEELCGMSSDGCSNALHTAVRLAVAATNAGNTDTVASTGLVTKPFSFSSPHSVIASTAGGIADALENSLQQRMQNLFGELSNQYDAIQHQLGPVEHEVGRWESVLRGRARRSDGARSGDGQGNESDMPVDVEQSQVVEPIILRRVSPKKIRTSSFPVGKPVSESGQRQKNSMAIVELLLTHPAMKVYTTQPSHINVEDDAEPMDVSPTFDDESALLTQMLSERDAAGMTPFMLAVHLRAYGAAMHIWNIVKAMDDQRGELLKRFVFPQKDGMFNRDDSPLFLLCYNDTCSFTWTGEDHINQDIYECRTCGLTGSLCCCSECALTCHRNHDCKLKRTSPTAYCDCWEKCACKALVAGNERKREELLMELLTHTKLYEELNGKNEHIILFLAKTIVRQHREQSCVPPRSKRRQFVAEVLKSGEPSQMPEHDLQPPKFARFALEACLKSYNVFKSGVCVGSVEVDGKVVCSLESMYVNVQSGASHLDKLVFTLMNKGMDKYARQAFETLRWQSNISPAGRDEQFEEVASRFTRSIIRVLALAINVSPVAASTIISGKAPEVQQASGRDENKMRLMSAIALSGFLPVMKRDSGGKVDKTASLASLVMRGIEMLRHLPAVSLIELAAAADSLLAPVRLGVVCEMINPVMIGNHDPVEILDKYFSSETSLAEQIEKARSRAENEPAPHKSRKRKHSRRDTERDDDDRRDSEDDSDGGGPQAPPTGSRRHYHDSVSVPDSNAVASAANEETDEPRVRVRVVFDDAEMNEDDGTSESQDGVGGAGAEGEGQDGGADGDATDGAAGEEEVTDEDEEDEEEEDSDDDGQAPLVQFISNGDHPVEDIDEGSGWAFDQSRSPPYEPTSPPYEEDEEAEGAEGANSQDSQERENTSSSHLVGVVRSTTSDTTSSAVDNSTAGGGGGGAAVDASGADNGGPSVIESEAREGIVDDSDDDFVVRQSGNSSISRYSQSIYRNRGNNWSSGSPRIRVYNRFGSRTVVSGNNSASTTANENAGSTAAERSSTNDSNNDRGTTNESSSRPNPGGSGGGGGSGGPSSSKKSSSNERSGSDDHTKGTKSQAQQQLSLTFSMLVRLGCDLIKQMSIGYSNDFRKSSANNILNLCEDMLDDSFTWLITQMDNIESKLRFNSGLREIGSNAPADLTTRTSRRATASSDKKSDESTIDVSTGRRDAFAYMMSLMRSTRDECADTPAHIDHELLCTLAYVFDAYLVFLNIKSTPFDEWKAYLDQFDESSRRDATERDTVDTDVMRRFFKRSNSFSYSGDAVSGAWNTLSTHPDSTEMKISTQIPLIERPDILHPDAKRESLFAPPISLQPVSIHSHQKMLEWQGVSRSHVASLTLSRPRPSCRTVDALKCLKEFYGDGMQVNTDSKSSWRHSDGVAQDTHRCEYECPEGMDPISVESMRASILNLATTPDQKLAARWNKTIELIGVECYDEIASSLGAEVATKYSPLLSSVSRFGVRHELFIKATEKYRTSHSNGKEVPLDVHRDHAQLIRDTVSQMNQMYMRRLNSMRHSDSLQTPLACTRLRVRFDNEPGEGSGVTRSFYTALAEACANLQKSPFDGDTKSLESFYLGGLGMGSSGRPKVRELHPIAAYLRENADSRSKRIRLRRERIQRVRSLVDRTPRMHTLNVSAPFYQPSKDEPLDTASLLLTKTSVLSSLALMEAEGNVTLPSAVGKIIYSKIMRRNHNTSIAQRVTSMLLELPFANIKEMISNDDTLRLFVDDAINLLRSGRDIDEICEPYALPPLPENDDGANSGSATGLPTTPKCDEPLFAKTSKKGFYAPVIGNGDQLRVSAFRNIGRVMGICLSQGDIFPLRLSRHVFKYILHRPVTWLDLAFHDPQVFDSLRDLLRDDHPSDFFDDLQMRFSIEVAPNVIELKPGGDECVVTRANIVEYVYRYAERILLGPNIVALEAMRDGVLDVIPETLLQGLTAEDLRLILCGTEEVCIETLQANTLFLDESRAAADVLTKFKQWFWQVVETLNTQERQDLVFFWTGAPTLPPAGDWQTNATVMLRPAEDQFLPTANTCISRLYVPVYSSKKILRQKLLLAIKAKNFGFV